MTETDDSEPAVPVVCPECDTTTRVSLSEADAAIERHNDALHDGEAVAGVDPEVADRLADLVAEDMGLLDGA